VGGEEIVGSAAMAQTNDDGGFDVDTNQCERTGLWSCTCPLCPLKVVKYTEAGLMEALCDHMNSEHDERRRGHA
jgi:hypothetical protein